MLEFIWCADPSLILLGLGTAASVGGSILQGNEQSAALNANAAANDEAAKRTALLGSMREGDQRIQNRRLEGQQIASVGANGLTLSGSALDFTIDQAIDAEMAALNERYGADVQATSYRNQAAADRAGANAAKKAGLWSGAAALLQGGANIYGQIPGGSSGGGGSGWAAVNKAMRRA